MISYHKAKVEDAGEIKKLLFKTWTSAYSDIYSQDAIKTVTSEWHSISLLTKQILNPKMSFIIARQDKIIIGMCNALYKPKNNLLYIQRLHVDPEFQNQGIGTKLISKIIEVFPKAKKLRLEVEKQNNKAFIFYQKRGFEKVGSKIFLVKGVRMPSLIMEKSI